MAKRKIMLFQIQAKKLTKTDFNGENARNINVPVPNVCIVAQICFIQNTHIFDFLLNLQQLINYVSSETQYRNIKVNMT